MNHLRTPPVPKLPFHVTHPPPQATYHPPHNHHQSTSFSSSSSTYSHPTLTHNPTFTPQTEYMRQLLALDSIPSLHNILAASSTWLLLAGFIILPGTFTTLQKSNPTSELISTTLSTVQHIPLLILASISSALGALGMLTLLFLHRDNYIWIGSRVLLPGVMNSVMGMLGTLVGVYGSQKGVWSTSAIVTGSVVGGVGVVCGGLWGVYNFVLLGAVKKGHEREVGVGVVGLGIKEKRFL
ncbi:hypothetical protein BJ875DRAFT_365185 [Amylocarpus encephaloides]|uniref:Uncharacterized protein n=1 Tax=Amylocarpus encephaloides TaxID=45428 RepID=A0A9P7YTU9_9HELO|nr:hypothetical protein BJ875DRAFT_365185 [Amylocarpus encephaloides]